MPAPVNRLKQRLAAGEVLHGIWLALADGYAAQVAATAGFDWLLIDNEHAPNDLRSTLAQLAVLEGGASAPVVRLPDGDPARIKQTLDIGVQSLMIPMVESAAQAAALVRATRYPPEGFRGVGAGLARASRFGRIADYTTTANAQICLMLQIESRAGIAALDGILATPGVDVVFLGPADLAADMGHTGQSSHPDVVAAVTGAIARIRAAGLAAGVMASDPALTEACKAAGANFVGLGSDVNVLASALQALAARHCEPDGAAGG